MKTPPISGFLLANKSKGITSFKVVKRVRSCAGGSKVGHAGTLDPLATGVLILGLGRSTKKISAMADLEKEYLFSVKLGLSTETDDIYGKTLAEESPAAISREDIQNAIPAFIGRIKQLPPRFSAKKIKGKPAYTLARKGINVSLEKTAVTIHALELLSFDAPEAKFRMVCSKGTYVRSFARDLGAKLGCGGCVSELARVRIGPFVVGEAMADTEILPKSISSYLIPEQKALEIVREYQCGEKS